MTDLGKRYDFHIHSIFSDGSLLPAALVREAEVLGSGAIAISDHVDPSNLEFVISSIKKFITEMDKHLPIKVFCGVEISYLKPEQIPTYCKKAKDLGADLIIVHGETPVEPVYKGTNHAAVSQIGLVDILAHPGNITDADVQLAAQNNIFLELSTRNGHKNGNQHVANLATKYGAKLLVNTDTHTEKDMITQEQAFEIAKAAGLNDAQALKIIKDNPLELINRMT